MSRISRQFAFLTGHPLTKDKPLHALGRFLAWQVRSRLTRENEFQWIAGSKLLVRHGMTGATGNIYCGLHEFADMAFLLHFLRKGELFGDVGANIGSYTVLATVACGARTLAIEPDPGTAASLRKNIALNKAEASAQVAETAVGEHQGTIRFTTGLDTMNKVSTEGSDNAFRVVPLTTLDQLFARETPVMLKLDVEGFEGPVLRGAARLLQSSALLAVQSECRDADVLDLLRNQGFEERHYNPFTRQLTTDAEFPQSNGLFLRNIPEVQKRLQTARRFTVLHHDL